MDANGVEVTILPTDSPGYVFEDPTQRTLLSVIVILVAAVGIPGNILVMIAVTFSKRLQTKTNSFVVNLACSDLAACLVLPFQVVALLNDSWPLPDPLCTFVAVVVWVGLGSSVVNLALIAFNRFTLITKSRTHYDQLYSKRNLVLMLVSAWIIPIVLVTAHPCVALEESATRRYKICSADSTILYRMFTHSSQCSRWISMFDHYYYMLRQNLSLHSS
ncbi:putative muscarinic acetylcholine receptor M2-like [Apostichopus japonicus]|uniref:Putative muscarinic acetylcholine receptor M2-like n=1 Tax=Stichopus japonicus TaxID=307972 RepID=A0A2G8JLT8_STIJA|nr:putative muscarinic acetylcholine receptor M2-like [Apostichopus japonicus]